MQIQFTGHQVEITTALQEFTITKFERLQRFANMISNVHVIFDINKLLHVAEAKIKLHGNEIHARAESSDMYTAIDELIDKLMRQLIKHKEKQSDYR